MRGKHSVVRAYAVRGEKERWDRAIGPAQWRLVAVWLAPLSDLSQPLPRPLTNSKGPLPPCPN